MRIRAIDVFGYTVTYAHGEYVMSGGRVAAHQTGTLVKVSTDEGLCGWGEVTPHDGTYLPVFTGGVQAGLRELGPALLGVDATNLNLVNRTMDAVLLGQQYAKSPIDMACWDIAGQALGQPVAALVGGVMQPDYPIYEPVPLGPSDAMADYIEQRRAVGIERFQLKVGNDPYEDAERTRACLAAGGGDTLFDVDANGGWSLLDARIAAQELAGLPVSLEQPCRTTEDCALVTEHSALPLVLDESVVTLTDVMAAKQAGAVAINVKISRVGGISKAVLMRDLMQRLNMRVSIEDSWGGDIVSAAVSHIAASTDPDHLFFVPPLNELTADGFIAGHQPRSVNGRVAVPTGPGLGIEVDEAALGAPLFSIT